MASAAVHQINTSLGGVPKLPVAGPVEVTKRGVDGDKQKDLIHHGAPHQALCVYSLEIIEALVAEGHEIGPGRAGENLTITGLDWASLRPLDRFLVGPEMVMELTSPAAPCSKNAQWFSNRNFRRIEDGLHPGWARWYARVVTEGTVSAGDMVELLTAADGPVDFEASISSIPDRPQ